MDKIKFNEAIREAIYAVGGRRGPEGTDELHIVNKLVGLLQPLDPIEVNFKLKIDENGKAQLEMVDSPSLRAFPLDAGEKVSTTLNFAKVYGENEASYTVTLERVI